MRRERLGSGTAGDCVQHGRLDGNEVSIVEPTTHVGVDLGAGDENISGTIIHHQVEISVTESRFGVLEAIVIVGNLY